MTDLEKIASELHLPIKGVAAVVGLLADANTVPFIARYRKEATGGFDEVQIRAIEERRGTLIELADRRKTILAAIDDQGKLTAALRGAIEACEDKASLEDLYLPYKRKRRTRAAMARDRGLEPLALRILDQPSSGNPRQEAAAFVDESKECPDTDAALAGARDIVAEVMAERADIRSAVRRVFAERGVFCSKAARGKSKERTKFEQYYDFREPVKSIPSHRFLAIRRGEAEGVLRANIDVDADYLIGRIGEVMKLAPRSPFGPELLDALKDGYRRLLAPSVENDVRVEMKLRSDGAAVQVFADNLRNLLLASPLGAKSVVGIDPGLRTGCKCVAIDATGKFLDTTTIYLARKGTTAAAKAFVAFVSKYRPVAIAVGNGTGGRETETFVRDVLRDQDLTDLFAVQVNESGASIYSASDVAREEFPDLDLTIRGAISIARRLQDPLAELVKLDPKSIGVGQYQHDVYQPLLQRKLVEVVESCVNHVGVELNTASAPLLAHVAGVSATVAKKIVAHRESVGAFRSRRQLLKVSGLGPKSYEQAAGFLRIRGGEHPLDASAVHPERYSVVEGMAADLGVGLAELVGNPELVARVDTQRYVSQDIGEPTLRDIVSELDKPGRDPRDEFEAPKFRDDVNSIDDLVQDMVLEGVVTNVTAFGAFVDIGVHDDGLVHVSELSERFVKDPKEVVKVGDKLKVRVMEVDTGRRRISLSARSPEARPSTPQRTAPQKHEPGQSPRKSGATDGARSGKFGNNPFAKLRGPK